MTSNPTFIPLVYRDHRKRIINQLGRFTPPSTLDRLLAELSATESNDLERMRTRPPWRTLLLLKWFFEQRDVPRGNLRPMAQGDLISLINQVAELESSFELPSQHPDFNIFLRKIAHQQFWFQENLQVSHFARQSLLFRHLPEEHPLFITFQRVIGTPLNAFIALLVAMTIPLATRKLTVERQFFSTLEPFFSPSAVDTVLATLSRDRDQLRTYLRDSQHSNERSHYEYYSRTPLTRFPLLREGSRFTTYSSPVLARGTETLVYDILRNHDPSTFMDHFGAVFEGYVRRGIEHMNHPFMDEKEVRRRFGVGKVVDFVLPSPKGTLFIEAKGVELPVAAMVTLETEFLNSRLHNSIFKALEQAGELATRMALTEPPFVLVVTYKHFLLGNGSSLQDIAKNVSLPQSVKSLDMTRIYFASIEEFDYLAAGLRAHGNDPVEFFKTVRTDDQDHRTRKFMLMQHINDKLRPYGTPDYLRDEESALMDVLREALPKA